MPKGSTWMTREGMTRMCHFSPPPFSLESRAAGKNHSRRENGLALALMKQNIRCLTRRTKSRGKNGNYLMDSTVGNVWR